jgi:hypothetical protein
VKIAALALRSDRYRAPEQRRAFFHSVMARLNDVPGIRVDDSGSALPLAGDAYFALFFSMGDGSPGVQLPNGQRFIKWQADTGPDSLAKEINHAVKTLDRGIHYWHVGLGLAAATTWLLTGHLWGVSRAHRRSRSRAERTADNTLSGGFG